MIRSQRVKTYPYRGASIVVRRWGQAVEYLVVYRKKLYSDYVAIDMRASQKAQHNLFAEGEMRMMAAAEVCVDNLKRSSLFHRYIGRFFERVEKDNMIADAIQPNGQGAA